MDPSTHSSSHSQWESPLNPKIIGFIAALQGIILTYLFRSVESKWWPGTDPTWLVATSTFFLAFPVLFYLSATAFNTQKRLAYLLSFSGILAFLAGYVESQSRPNYGDIDAGAMSLFTLTAGIATHHALIYIQHLCEGGPLRYQNLFKRSWYNAVLLGSSLLFSGILFGILHLGASLFSLLGIEVFGRLLDKDWVVIPLFSVSLGLAITLFRQRIHAADNIIDTIQPLFKYLLPVLSILVISILAVLPFTGLNKLWGTGNASLLMLWLQVLTLFFVNGVYQQDRHETPYANGINRAIVISVALLPIYSGLVFYGLWLRIDQYGLTVDRAWAVLINLLVTGFTLGYTTSIVKSHWLRGLSKVNIAMGAVLSLAMLAVNSPLLNFNQLAANSQISRFENGDIKLDELDVMYLRDSLGQPGYEALVALQTRLSKQSPEQAAQLQEWIDKGKQWHEPRTLEGFEQSATFWPQGTAFPPDLIAHIFKNNVDTKWANPNLAYYFVAIDLNDDHAPEWVVLEDNDHMIDAYLWQVNNEKWQSQYLGNVLHKEGLNEIKSLKLLIESNQVEAITPTWKHLKIGDFVFKTR